jgi:hypothetical protein
MKHKQKVNQKLKNAKIGETAGGVVSCPVSNHRYLPRLKCMGNCDSPRIASLPASDTFIPRRYILSACFSG